MFLFTINCINGQAKEQDTSTKIHISLSPIIGLHVNIFNKGLESLNSSLSFQGKYPVILPVFNSAGVAIVFKTVKDYSFTELSILQASHDIDDKTKQYRFVPKLKGYAFRSIYTKKLWEKGKKRIDGGFGMSMSKFDFNLVDRLIIQSPFDTLLKSPINASGSLDYAQSSYNWNLEGRLGLTYNAGWFKKSFDAYEFSFFINYSQALYTSKNWVVSDTNIKVPNFPTINFSNVYFQFVNSIYFKRK